MLWFWKMTGERWDLDSRTFAIMRKKWHRLVATQEVRLEEDYKTRIRQDHLEEQTKQLSDIDTQSNQYYLQNELGGKGREEINAMSEQVRDDYGSRELQYNHQLLFNLTEAPHSCQLGTCCLQATTSDFQTRVSRLDDVHKQHRTNLELLQTTFTRAIKERALSVRFALKAGDLPEAVMAPSPILVNRFNFTWPHSNLPISACYRTTMANKTKFMEHGYELKKNECAHYFGAHECPNKICCRTEIPRFRQEHAITIMDASKTRKVADLALERRRAEMDKFESKQTYAWERRYKSFINKDVFIEAVTQISHVKDSLLIEAEHSLLHAFRRKSIGICF